MQGWFWLIFLVFSVLMIYNPDYIPNYPFAAKWAIQRGQGEGSTYRLLLDKLGFDDVTWRLYEEHMEI